MANKEKITFQEENEILEKALSISAEEKSVDNMLKEYKDLTQNYKKLLKQFRKIIKISDHQQLLLNKKNIELENKNNEIINLSKLKDDFLAIASHDLRGPFSSIIGFTKIMLASDDISDKHKKRLKHILDSANIQLDYINDLMEIIMLEGGRIKLNRRNVNIEAMVNKCVNSFSPLASNKNIDLSVNIINSCKCYIDYPKIVQVINNLIGNAIKFTHAGGKITVEVLQVQKEQVEIHIKDTGVGISEENIALLFTRYKKLRNYGTDGERGTGLGLSICSNLIDLHGGSIHVESVEDEGSDFYFTLPIS